MVDETFPDLERFLDLDPQEAIEAGYDPATDIDSFREMGEPSTPEDDAYEPQLDESLAAFDPSPWPGDRLIIVNDDGGYDTADGEDEDDGEESD